MKSSNAQRAARIGVLLFATACAGPTSPHNESGFVSRSLSLGSSVYRYQVYVPPQYWSSNERWPVILFLHGAGETGFDGVLQTTVGLGPAIRQHPQRYPAIVVFPQASWDSSWIGATADIAMSALDATVREFRVDSSRVYLTGLSLGGNGTWNLGYWHRERFAAIAPICGWVSANSDPRRGIRRAIIPADSGDVFAALARQLGELPVWIVHGEADPLVDVDESRQAAAALQAAGAPVRYVEILSGGHNVWDATYGSEEFANWLFAQRRASARVATQSVGSGG